MSILLSKNIVVVRMGETSDPTNSNFSLSSLDDDI